MDKDKGKSESREQPRAEGGEEEDALERWLRLSTAMNQNAAGVDWSKVKVDPRNLSFGLGPALTEEQFRAFQRRNGGGGRPTIIKTNDTHKTG